jgi:hypothetical protein
MGYTISNSIIFMGAILVPAVAYLVISGEWRKF